MGKATKQEAKTDTVEAQARDTVLKRAKSTKVEFDNARHEFIHNAEVNPKQAIGWSKAVVTAQVRFEDCWLPLENRLADNDDEPIAEILDEHIRRLRQRLGWTLGGGSTCPFDRAIDRIKGETIHHEIEYIENLLDWITKDSSK